jgi:hypothetical protein
LGGKKKRNIIFKSYIKKRFAASQPTKLDCVLTEYFFMLHNSYALVHPDSSNLASSNKDGKP